MGKNKYYCKINGIIENLGDIQKLIDAKEFHGKITLAMHENHGMDINDAIMFEDVLRFDNWEIPADFNEASERLRANNSKNQPKCLTCGSTNVRKMKQPWLPPLYTDPKQFKCLHCGYEW